ncbi:TPA: hypothetical protein ACN36C_004600 [Vibrio parahaemolyticus]
MKTWLENNKVYFETVAPVFISIAALLVSVSSFMLTNQQLDLAKVEHQPNIYLKESYLYDEKLQSAYETELRVINTGAEISNFSQKVRSLLELEFYTDTGKYATYLPIYGYYDTSFRSSEPTGELVLVKGYMNNTLFHNLYVQTLSSDFNDKYGTVFVKLIHGTQVSYVSKLGENRNEYFVGKTHATKEQFDSLFANYDSFRPVELNKVTSQQLGEKVLEFRAQLEKSHNKLLKSDS